jgi:ABC-type branched-subunit amino acid transport system ATPase component
MTLDLPALDVRGVVKGFGGNRALDDCSFTVPSSSVVGLIGPNGAGKTTLIDVISGLQRPDAGSIKVHGRVIDHLPPHRIARLGLARTFQNAREWPRLTVFENVLAAFPNQDRESVRAALLSRRRIRAAEHQRRHSVEMILANIGLTSVANEYAGNLSGGQKRLLEFARVSAAEPNVVLLDEPLAGVNPGLWPEIAAAIRAFANSGAAVVVVEHNLEFVDELCERVIVMALGRVMMTGDMNSIRKSPEVIEAYLGGEVAHESLR